MSASPSEAPTWLTNAPLRTCLCERGAKIATWQQVLVTIWSGQPSGGLLQPAVEQLHQLAQQYPHGVVSLTILEQGLALPSAAERRDCLALIQKTRGLIFARALVLQGEGFWSSAFRSMMTGLNYVRDSTACVVANREVAVAHLSRHLQAPATWRAGLLRAVHQLEQLPSPQDK